MRDFLDAILSAIGSESLTDEEFDGLDLENEAYDRETYEALHALLIARESITDQTIRLQFFFLARGVDLSESGDAKPPVSEVLIGDALD